MLVLAGLFAMRVFSDELTEIAFVPTAEFEEQPELAANVYQDPAMWISRPGLGDKDPAVWTPDGFAAEEEGEPLDAAVFFVHPTSYMERAHWNAPLDDAVSRNRAELYVRGMASPFNRSAELWAPRYRQAAFGAFLTDRPETAQALDAAYGDIVLAFDYFVEAVARDRPIVLAGHSQGAYHLRRLIRDRVAGTPLASRIAAAYVIGWPVSIKHDLPAMGMPACENPDQGGCVLSWMSMAEPADTTRMREAYAKGVGLDGKLLEESPFVCTNPLTGAQGGAAEASANLATLVPDLKNRSGELAPGVVPARCGEDGLLYIGAPPELELGPYVLPGNNYHLYDIVLFWANVRADVARRIEAWKAAR